MKMKWDASELTDFGKRLTSDYEFQTTVMTLTQEIARALHEALLTRTPILTGNLRKMWSAGDNLLFTVEKKGNGYEVTLENNAKNENGYMYGTAVNDGHYSRNGGWVRGRFFVENSILDTEEKLNSFLMKEFDKWIRWCVNGK